MQVYVLYILIYLQVQKWQLQVALYTCLQELQRNCLQMKYNTEVLTQKFVIVTIRNCFTRRAWNFYRVNFFSTFTAPVSYFNPHTRNPRPCKCFKEIISKGSSFKKVTSAPDFNTDTYTV